MSTDTTEKTAEDIAYSLGLGYSTAKLAEPLQLAIGDEVTALVRIRITGTGEREPLGSYDVRTVTTDAKILDVVEIDGTPLPKVEPAADPNTVTCRKWERTYDRWGYAFFGAAGSVGVLYILALIEQLAK